MYVRKQEMLKINNPSFCNKKTEKEQQIKYKESRIKEIKNENQ